MDACALEFDVIWLTPQDISLSYAPMLKRDLPVIGSFVVKLRGGILKICGNYCSSFVLACVIQTVI